MRTIWRSRGVLLALLLAVCLLGAMTWLWARSREATRQQIVALLDSGHRLQLRALEDLKAQFTQDTARMAEDPAFVAYVLASRDRGSAGLASIADLLGERLGDLGADAAEVFSAAGEPVAGVGELGRQAAQIQRWKALRQVLERGEAVSGWWPQGDGVALLAITPLRQGPLLEGLLVTARQLDAAQLAERVKSSQLQGRLFEEHDASLRPLLAGATPSTSPEAPLQRWQDSAAAPDAGVRLSTLPALEQPVWLLTTLDDDRRDALQAEQRRLIMGLAGVAAGILVMLGWIWRNGRRRGLPLVRPARQQLAGTVVRARSSAPVMSDQERGELLHEVVQAAQSLGSASRPAQPADAGGIPDNRYQPISFQGETSLARIYRVDDRLLNRVMLLFVLHSGTPRDTARSLRIATELGQAGLVQHRNLVSVQRVARAQSRLLVAMDDVSGLSLRELTERVGTLPPEAALLVAKRIGAAQLRLNEAGVLLRSIDPDQVLFLPDGAVKLLPLALAGSEVPPVQRLAAWTAEQWLAADKRSDVLAFGELLGGLLGSTDPATADLLPPAWRGLLERCTASDPALRHAGMDAVMTELDNL